MTELKEFLHVEYNKLVLKPGFNTPNRVFNELAVMYPFCSVSTIKRAYYYNKKQVSFFSSLENNQTQIKF